MFDSLDVTENKRVCVAECANYVGVRVHKKTEKFEDCVQTKAS